MQLADLSLGGVFHRQAYITRSSLCPRALGYLPPLDRGVLMDTTPSRPPQVATASAATTTPNKAATRPGPDCW